MPVYTVGRAYLIELLQSELQSNLVRFVDSPMAKKAYTQLEALETVYRESGLIYGCLPGQHDDLGISCAMLGWAARHPHLPSWIRNLDAMRRPRQTFGWGAFTKPSSADVMQTAHCSDADRRHFLPSNRRIARFFRCRLGKKQSRARA